MAKVQIQINNNKCKLIAHKKHLIFLREEFKIRAKNYFWSQAYRNRQWDGYVRYISELTGQFDTGLLDQVVALLEKNKYKYTIQDNRVTFKPIRSIKKLGGLKFRPDQLEAVDLFLTHTIAGVKFRRGIMAEATNAGKSLIAGGIFASFSNKRTGLFLVNSVTLYEQAVKDFEALFPGDVGQVNRDKFIWKRINVCMVQTLYNRLHKFREYKNKLAKIDMVIVDEGDELIGRKDCRYILGQTYNAPVRVCLSGTPLKHKDKTKNQQQLSFFGPIIHRIKNKELVELGVSTQPIITMSAGNASESEKGNFQGEYDLGITRNRQRHKRVWKRVEYHLKKGRKSIVILFKYHSHGRRLMKSCPHSIINKHMVGLINSKSVARQSLLDDFKKGRIPILICSMIIRRGINIPIMKVLVNAAGGDSESNLLQILGRALRKHHKKKVVYIEDFWDQGHYLRRHSRHRLAYYKREGFKVREKF